MENRRIRGGPIRKTEYMGMVWAIAEAEKKGFSPSDPEWCNFGKGQPETLQMTGGADRINQVTLTDDDHNYGPVNGTDEFRQAVADHYNRMYRKGKIPYTKANVAVAQGGRLMLSRLFRILQGRVGYQTPDYAGYQDLFDSAAGKIDPIHIPTSEDNCFAVPPEHFAEVAQDLDSFMCSNPANPTGHLLEGDDLTSYCRTARTTGCLLILDEFYSHFVYRDDDAEKDKGGISAAAKVVDPNSDPVLIIDGMTKCFRYPGWRLAWMIGPPEFVDAIGCVASGLDGGPSTVCQRMALEALRQDYATMETVALRQTFLRKRDEMHRRLSAMGLRYLPCDSTFYMWCCIESLPAPLNTCMGFFRAALDRKVIVGPGKFFDINPGGKRPGENAFDSWIRLSFGPSFESISHGLSKLEEMLEAHSVCKSADKPPLRIPVPMPVAISKLKALAIESDSSDVDASSDAEAEF